MNTKPTIEIFDKQRLIKDFTELGVCPGDLLNVKVSLNSIGYIIGGPNTLIEALIEIIGTKGTIVTDSFVPVYDLPLNKSNALKISDRYTLSYAGALANAMIYYPNAYRSMHPVQKFVAIGSLAKELMLNHGPNSFAYDVLKQMAESGQGRNLKIGGDRKVPGVGTTHVAQGILKLHQNQPLKGINYYDYQSGEIKLFIKNWSGGCSEGFYKFLPLYSKAGAIISEGKIGNAESKITDMKKTLEVEIETLSNNPSFFFCDNPACKDCRLSWDFSTGNPLSVKFHKIKRLLNIPMISKKINLILND